MTLLIVVKGRTSVAADLCIGPIDASSRDLASEVNTTEQAKGKVSEKQVSPNALRSNGVEDGNGVLASLVVYPVRIVVPVERWFVEHVSIHQ